MLRSRRPGKIRSISSAINSSLPRLGAFRSQRSLHQTIPVYEPLEHRRLMSVNVPTYHYSTAETGANTNETVLTQANVNTSTFGKVASMPVDGQMYAQPLVMSNINMGVLGTHDILLVATENDSVYAFDAYGNNPAQGYLWKTSLLQAGETTVPESDYGTTDITPQLGITGTPVIDPSTNTLYVVGLFKESNSTYQQRLYAINITNGANAISPVVIAANVSGSTFNTSTYSNPGGVVTFSALRENQRPALTLANGEVYIGWASHGDQNPWHGWLMAYHASNLHLDYAYCTTLDGQQGGIWMSGGGIAVDSSGNLYFTTGNGDFNGSAGNIATQGTALNLSMAVEKLSPTLTPLDYFAPFNQASLSAQDLDYGCSNVILLSNQPGANPDQMLTAGKWGTIYLNSSATGSLGEFNSTTNQDLGEANITSNVTTASNVHQTMAYWNGYVYLAGDGLPLEAFSVANFSTGKVTAVSSQSGHDFGTASIEDAQGGGLTVSSNGNANGILWALDNSAYNTTSATSYSSSGPAVLYAYNANNLAQPLWSSASAAGGRDTAGTAIKFQDPVVANGHVYVAGMNSVTVFGLLTSSSNAPTVTTVATANPATTTGSTNLTIAATDPGTDAAPAYFWAASSSPNGAATPTFTINNSSSANATTATFYKAGTYTLTCTVEDPSTGNSVISNVVVTVAQTLTSISISPSGVNLKNGATQQFTASVNDQFGNPLASQPPFTWSVNSGGVGGTISPTGLYTAPVSGIGTDSVTATSTLSTTALVTVAVLGPTVQVDLSSAYNRVGIVSDGTTFASGIDGTGGSAASGNLLGTSQSWNGYNFVIPAANASNTVNNVVYGAGQAITVPQNRYGTLQLLALHVNGNVTGKRLSVTYTDGTTANLSAQSFSDWFTPQSYAGESKAISMPYRDNTNGTQGSGPFNVYGYTFALNPAKILKSITLFNDTNFVVIAADLINLVVTTPASASPAPVTGMTTTLSALATDPSGDAAPTYTWATTSLPAGAAAPNFSVNGTSGSNVSTVTLHAAGVYTFTVTMTDPTSGLSTTSSVGVVVNQTLSSILETPVTAKVYDGGSRAFTANAYDQFGQLMSSQPTFTWSVKPGGIGGTVNASSGVYVAPASGTGTDILNASSGSITGASTITVLNPIPTITSPAAANPAPVAGTTTVLTVLAVDAAPDVKPVYSWATTNLPVGATTPIFSDNGTDTANVSTATFYKAGAYTFTVTITDLTSGGSTTSSVNVIVNQTPTGITVTPASAVLVVNGQSQQFSASALDQFGAAMSPQPAIAWSVASGIGSVDGTGLYRAPPTGTGSASVRAAVGSVNAAGIVQVVQPAWLGGGSAAVWNSATKILTVTGATSIIADPGGDQPIITANGSSAVVTINPATALQIHIGGIKLSGGATAIVTSLGGARTASNHRVLVLGLPGAVSAPLLDLGSSSSLDLTDNDLVEHTGNLPTVIALTTSGFNARLGYWNGNGINSSAAATSAPKLQTLGVSQPVVAGTFDHETVAPADVVVAFTYYGDANLDGHVDGSDYSRIDNGFLGTLAGYNNGDFNFDGVVNGSDYTLIDNAFNSQGASLLSDIATPAAQLAVPVVAVPSIVATHISLSSLTAVAEHLVIVTKIAPHALPIPVAVDYLPHKHKVISLPKILTGVTAFSDVKILA